MAVLKPARARRPEPLPGPLSDRLSRIAWLAARSHGVRLGDVLDPPPFNPGATRARMMAIAATSELLNLPLHVLGRYFGDGERAMAMACDHARARAADDADFRTAMGFLRTSCAAVLGLAV